MTVLKVWTGLGASVKVAQYPVASYNRFTFRRPEGHREGVASRTWRWFLFGEGLKEKKFFKNPAVLKLIWLIFFLSRNICYHLVELWEMLVWIYSHLMR